MIKVENIEVFNFEGAFRGMRNAKESWDKSDSEWKFKTDEDDNCIELNYVIGENDMKLALTLVKAGRDHSKFMRSVLVSMDITAPLYWFKEYDTYKVGTVANSTSTMHKLSTTPITNDCFSFDEYTQATAQYQMNLVHQLESLRQLYNETKEIKHWVALIQLLPSGWNQKRTCTLNYAVLRNMYHSRKNHKLQEWRDFCKVIEELPYSELITIKGE
jgi:hypothetical protein